MDIGFKVSCPHALIMQMLDFDCKKILNAATSPSLMLDKIKVLGFKLLLVFYYNKMTLKQALPHCSKIFLH